jgi:PAS domain S-box-containing protein
MPSESRLSHAELERRLANAEAALHALREGQVDTLMSDDGPLVVRLALAEARAAHIKQVLLAIRNVNQLIVLENDPVRLCERACENLTETLGYFNAWMVLFDPETGCEPGRPPLSVSGSGGGAGFEQLRAGLARGEFPGCMRRALEEDTTLVVDAPLADCAGCPMAREYDVRAGMSRRLVFEGRTYGLLGVSVPAAYVHDAEELDLFEELAGDLTFAFYKIETAQKLRASERRYQELFARSRDGFVMVDVAGRIIDANEAYCAMLGYSLDELRGMPSFLAITPLRWHAWEREEIWEKRLLGTGYSGLYEKEYQRKDGTVFPVELESYAVRRDEGTLDYLWGVVRDISERKRVETAEREAALNLQEAVRAGNVGLWDWDLVTNQVRFSREWKRQIGYGEDEIGDTFAEWESRVHPDDLEPTFERVREAIDRRESGYRVEFRFRHKDGSYRWILAQSSVLTCEDGTPVRMLGSHFDVTERRNAEDALGERECYLQTILQTAADGFWIVGAQQELVEVNEAYCAMSGYTREELLGMRIGDIEAVERPEETAARVARIVAYGSEVFETVHRRKDGSMFPVEVAVTYLDAHGGQMFCFYRDLSERKAAEAQILAKQAELEAVYEHAPVMMCLLDENRQVIYANSAFTAFTGVSEEALRGGRACGVFGCVNAGEDPRGCGYGEPCAQCTLLRALTHTVETGANQASFEKHLVVERDGARHAYWLLGSTALIPGDGPRRVLLCMSDITATKEASEALRLFETIFHTAHFGMGIARMDGTLVYINEFFAALHGYRPEDLVGGPLDRLHAKSQLPEVHRYNARMLTEGAFGPVEVPHCHRDGTEFPMLMTGVVIRDEQGTPEYFAVTALDIRAQKEMEAQLNQAQKMESVGRLAGGVAHDFNNMLNVILGHCDMLMEDSAPDSTLHENLGQIHQAAKRSADLTGQLLAFARRQTVAPKQLNLNKTVEPMLKMLRRLIGEDIALHWNPAPALAPVFIDPAQIDQILVNLTVNARDAIESEDGVITIETSMARLEGEYCALYGDIMPGAYVMLAVSDNGHGMDAATRAQIFEPFFTTKPVGEGTGLGLPTVYGIAKQNRGMVLVYSEPGLGSTFKVYLPVYLPPTQGDALPGLVESTLRRGHETILLVEDEPPNLVVAAKMLERLGYQVVTAASPEEAMQCAAAQAGEIHLLITDVVMPGMNGRDLAGNLMSKYPGLKRIFMSGYTADVIAKQGVLDPDVDFLQKPFSMKDLGNIVRRVLDA